MGRREEGGGEEEREGRGGEGGMRGGEGRDGKRVGGRKEKAVVMQTSEDLKVDIVIMMALGACGTCPLVCGQR